MMKLSRMIIYRTSGRQFHVIGPA